MTTTITKPSKILITGDPGAGKTTTAKLLEEKFGIPTFNIDKYMFKDACEFNPYHEFKESVNKIIENNDNYILDGYSFGNDLDMFGKVANEADLILDFDFPTTVALRSFLNRTDDIVAGKTTHVGMNMGTDYGTPKQFKFFLKLYAEFIEEKEKRNIILEQMPSKTIKLRNFDDVDKIIVDLTNKQNN